MIGALPGAGLAGLHRGLASLRRDAQTIARTALPSTPGRTTPPRERLSDALAGLVEDRARVTASTRWIHAADQALESLLDLRA